MGLRDLEPSRGFRIQVFGVFGGPGVLWSRFFFSSEHGGVSNFRASRCYLGAIHRGPLLREVPPMTIKRGYIVLAQVYSITGEGEA